MTTFGLVHGAWHGGWCWEQLIPELRARGHNAVAPDLPAEDLEASWADYGRVVADALEGVTDDVVLVGHSLGAMTIPMVTTLRPVRRLVFLCGVIPQIDPEKQPDEPAMDPPGAFDVLVRHEGSTSWPSIEAATPVLYQDCTAEDVRAAWPRLRRQAYGMWNAPYPLEHWPDAELVTILCEEDRAISPAWSRWAAHRLRTEAIALPGGHSPFLSRPAELAGALTSRL